MPLRLQFLGADEAGLEFMQRTTAAVRELTCILAARVREETTVTIRWLASRLQMGTRQTLNAALYRRRKEHEQVNSTV